MAISYDEIKEFWKKLGESYPIKPLNRKELAKLKKPFQSLADLFRSLNESNSNEIEDDIEARHSSPDNSLDLHNLSVAEFVTCPDFIKFCTIYWGKEWGKLIPLILSYRLEGIYQTESDRRSFRSRKNVTWYYSIIKKYIKSFNHLRIYGLGPKELLDLWMERPELFSFYSMLFSQYINTGPEFLPLFIAMELDAGNKKLSDYIHAAVYKSTGHISYEIIETLFYSHLESSWKMAADLLLAARLQEGLRQAITEKCNEGNLSAFRYLLKVIYDNNLLRFSSVKRAFDTWTGLGLESIRDKSFKTAFELACQFLNDPQKAQSALESDNPLEVYLGLWAIGNTEISEIQTITTRKCHDTSVSIPTKTTCLLICYISKTIFSYEEIASLLESYGKEDILRACVLLNTHTGLGYNSYTNSDKNVNSTGKIDTIRQLYERLKALIPTLPEKEVKIGHPIFSWLKIPFSSRKVWEMMIVLARDSLDQYLIDDLVSLTDKMPLDVRSFMVYHLLKYLAKETEFDKYDKYNMYVEQDTTKEKYLRAHWPESEIQRSLLFSLLQDKSIGIRSNVLDIIAHRKLSDKELIQVESLLSLKTADIRQTVIRIIQKSGRVKESAQRLRSSKNDAKLQAANELDSSHDEQPTAKLVDKAHGFGLYNPEVYWEPVLPEADRQWHPAELLRKHLDRINIFFVELNKLIEKYKDTEFIQTRSWDNSKTTVTIASAYENENPLLFGDIYFRPNIKVPEEEVVLPEVWNEFCDKQKFTVQELLAMIALSNLTIDSSTNKGNELFYQVSKVETPYTKLSFCCFIATIMEHQLLRRRKEIEEGLANVVKAIAVHTPLEVLSYKFKDSLYVGDYLCTIFYNNAIKCWLRVGRNIPQTPVLFACRYYMMKCAGNVHNRDSIISLADFLDAYQRGLIGEEEVFRSVFDIEPEGWHPIFEKAPLPPVLTKAVETAVELELKRGDLPTELSSRLTSLPRLEGTQWFVRLLNALGKYKLFRGCYKYEDTKAAVFSALIQASVPGNDETADTLRHWLKLYPVEEQRLIEAAMYAPAWLDIVGDYLKVKDFAMAGWYFHAHVNETLDERKAGIIARWSPVSPQEFKDGAFDPLWFAQAYKTVGKKMFDRLYDAAKYISDGANHRRSQIFADAALNRLNAREVEDIIKTKRNKEYVMAFGILPGKEKDFLHRYEVIQQFIKESKQFGAQRQASEKHAAEIALGNLARTAGFDDINRFIWKMESAQLDQLKHLFAPKSFGDVTVQLVINENGKPEIRVEKKGKLLKSVPAALKNDKYILELTEAVKTLRDQQSRALKSLENAMIREDVFSRAELTSLIQNPILAFMINKLLWKHGNQIDFWENLPDGEYTIAHPVDLFHSKKWSSWQKIFIERQLVQPFKQVFRELYTLNDDERLLENHSDRYAGHQIRPQQGLALLKSRGWVANYDDGLEKVDYRQNIVVQLTATADWFSPSDIEPPTLESVYFYERKSYKPLKLEKIPPIMFSEIMRDLDLMVSVAHAGGVDPEASHSTVEMRAAIMKAFLPYLKLKNVQIKKSHALIKGHFGEYTVHLGSGVCHQAASGMINILPVHSQHRGRIFLPFADDDPKTAEIVTKILLLAEDEKIQDPTLLSQLK